MADAYVQSLMSTGETVQRISRQHPVILLRPILVNGFFILLLAGSGAWLLRGAAADAGAADASSAQRWLAWIILAAALWPAYRLAMELLRWQSKRFVISSRRVLEIEGVFNRRVRDSNLDKVNDIVLNQSVMGRILDYGDMEIITGADLGINRLERLAQPIAFKRTILDNKEDFDALVRGGLPLTAQDGLLAPPQDASAALAEIAELRDKGQISQAEFEAKKAEILARI